MSQNLDPELPTILNQLGEASVQIEALAKSIKKGRFLVSRQELVLLSNHLNIVHGYVHTSIREGLNYEDAVPDSTKIGDKE